MRALVSSEEDEGRSVTHTELGALVAQVRLAIITGLDEEFLGDREVASLEVTAAQFAILKNVLKGSAQSACELCKSMDYDRGAMSRMIDRSEMTMRDQIESYAARLAVRIQSAGADLDPDILQLPGGSVIATLLWLYAKGSTALRKH